MNDDELLMNYNSFLSSVLIHTDNLERFLSCNTNLIEKSENKVILNCTSKLIYDKLISKIFPFASHFTSEAMELLISSLSRISSCKKM